MQEIILSEEYLVNVDGTSEGSQQKYFKDGIWYKKDFFGGEGQAEELASLLLSCSNLEPSQYVMYKQIRLNHSNGCCSEDFLQPNEQFVTIYRLYVNMRGLTSCRLQKSCWSFKKKRLTVSGKNEYTIRCMKRERR